MRKRQHSSGDLIADRRGSYAEALASEGAYDEAAEVVAQALELVPGWAAGWHNLGRYREETGDIEGAKAAWRRSAALDAEGQYGAALKLAAHGEQPALDGAVDGSAYVETLFDDYASRFETSLVDRLGYSVPDELAQMIAATVPVPVGVALDLGCGTGLVGERLRRMARRLEGVDLSEAMLAEARRKQIYDRLHKGELTQFLAGWGEKAGLVTAADVLNYTGALPPVLAAVRAVLAPGGWFGFSLEVFDGPEPLRLQTNLRYAHQPELALEACAAAGFEAIVQQDCVIRLDRGVPVKGVLVLGRAG